MTQKSLITIILDTTSSMESRVEATIAGLNEYIDGLRTTPTDTRISLVTFRAPMEKIGYHYNLGKVDALQLDAVLVAEEIKSVRKLTAADMVCDGFTPLLQAIKATITKVEESLGARRNVIPIVVIQTDGEENASFNTSNEEIKALIAAKEKAGWQFVFMGCGINAYTQGHLMGLVSESTMSYRDDVASTRSAFQSTSEITRSYLSGASASMAYSSNQKAAAGDAYQEAN